MSILRMQKICERSEAMADTEAMRWRNHVLAHMITECCQDMQRMWCYGVNGWCKNSKMIVIDRR